MTRTTEVQDLELLTSRRWEAHAVGAARTGTPPAQALAAADALRSRRTGRSLMKEEKGPECAPASA